MNTPDRINRIRDMASRVTPRGDVPRLTDVITGSLIERGFPKNRLQGAMFRFLSGVSFQPRVNAWAVIEEKFSYAPWMKAISVVLSWSSDIDDPRGLALQHVTEETVAESLESYHPDVDVFLHILEFPRPLALMEMILALPERRDRQVVLDPVFYTKIA